MHVRIILLLFDERVCRVGSHLLVEYFRTWCVDSDPASYATLEEDSAGLSLASANPILPL